MAPSQDSYYLARLFGLATFAVAAVGLYVGKPLLLPLALATLLCFVLTPLCVRLERFGLGRIPAVLTVVAGTFVLLGVLGFIVTRQVISLGERLPEYRATIVSRVRDLRSQTQGGLKDASTTIKEISQELTTEREEDDERGRRAEADSPLAKLAFNEAVAVKVVELPPSPLAQINTWLGPLVSPLLMSVLVVVLVIFMLIQREDLRNRLIELMGTSNLHTTTEALTDAASRVSRYLRMTLLINASYGAAVVLGLFAIGLPNAVLWGVLGMLLRYLPYVGPWTAAALPITLSLAVFPGWQQPLLTIGMFIVLELIVNNVLEPWLYSNSIGASTVGVIVSAGAWTMLWGPVGLFLAMPLTVCLVVAGNFFPPLRIFSILLGDRSHLSVAERIYQRLLANDENETRKLANEYLQHATLEQFCDEVLVPVLVMAERDQQSGLLRDQQQLTILRTAEELVDEMQAEARLMGGNSTPPLSDSRRLRVVCAPVNDQADEVVSDMLVRLLSSHGHQVVSASRDLLASELVQRVEDEPCDLVILSALPPLANRNGRYLCRLLRQRFATLPILYGLWDGAALDEISQGLVRCGASRVVTQLREALDQVHRIALERTYHQKTSEVDGPLPSEPVNVELSGAVDRA